ncbi:hypothetical protein HOLleu_28804 [Holothuria leucospilota]|uniref:Reverse transcriptase n=1 Tax=Holothuria leucospilota TaxID=206669 RepID=A0A9Q1BMU9_HOLLE|nr:hypothetical protein HOLleu_28804 [Holothuria leucospilota]
MRSCPQYLCSLCGQQGHTESRCPSVKCFRCQRLGHKSFNCPDKIANSTEPNEGKTKQLDSDILNGDKPNMSKPGFVEINEDEEGEPGIDTEIENKELNSEVASTSRVDGSLPVNGGSKDIDINPSQKRTASSDDDGYANLTSIRGKSKATKTTSSTNLCETFWNDQVHEAARREWGGSVLSSICSEMNRRGVSCLINGNSDIDVVNSSTFCDGRLLQINIIVDDQAITIFNVYAPCNSSERKYFFTDLQERIAKTTNQVIIGGDFNTVLNTYLDKYPPTTYPDQSRKPLKDLMLTEKLTDIWRHRNDDVIAFTRSRIANNVRSASRIDRFLLSNSLILNVSYCNILNYPFSDHDIITLRLNLSLFPRGSGVWIFNNQLLDDEDFCLEIGEVIRSMKMHTDFETNFLEWYDNLKGKIKYQSIKFSKRKQRKQRKVKRILEKQIMYEKYKAQKFCDYNFTRLQNLEDELNNIVSKEVKGAALRAKIQWFEEGERPTRLFLNLEKSRQKVKVMKSLLKDDGTVVTDRETIMHEQVDFYKNLYKRESTDKNASSALINNVTRLLSPIDTRFCDEGLKSEELFDALKSMKPDKSPGLDGLTPQFYKAFWSEWEEILMRLVHEIYNAGTLSNSMKIGMITLIPKKGDLRKLTNWRPISLLNTDYKIISKALATRLSKVISTLVSEDQSCCVPGRNIADNVILMNNIIRYLDSKKVNGYILKIDQYKAFDRVDHGYLFDVLQKMGFGDYFRNWIAILYNEITACIKHNGFISPNFDIHRGVRQGCPISAILYVLTAEPFHEAIVNCNKISGIKVGDHEAKIFQHADDTTFFYLTLTVFNMFSM